MILTVYGSDNKKSKCINIIATGGTGRQAEGLNHVCD